MAPRHLRSSRLLLVLAAAAGMCTLETACGKRGDPQPPLRRTPQPILDLALAQRGTQIEITFTTPAVSVDGLHLGALEVDLHWAEREGEFGRVASRRTIPAAAGERLAIQEPLPPSGTILRAAVRTRAGRHESQLSSIATLAVVAPLQAPSDLTVERSHEGVRLGWAGVIPEPPPPPRAAASPSPRTASPSAAQRQPPPPSASQPPLPPPVSLSPPAGQPRGVEGAPQTGLASQAPPSPPGFLIYRREGPAAYGAPLNSAPVADRSYLDAGAPAAATLCYIVRAASSRTPLIESAPSSEVCLEPAP